MSTDRGDNNGFVSDFLAKAGTGEGIDVDRLRDEIRKKIGTEDQVLGKFLGLVESFQEIIPEEKQRFHAAIKALTATSGASRENVLEAINNQLGVLAILEKGVLSALPGFRSELMSLQVRSEEIKDEIARLRETIELLEKEGQEIRGAMAAREGEMKAVEETVTRIFSDISAEITGIRSKIEEYTAVKPVPQPTPPPAPAEVREPKEVKPAIEEAGGPEEPHAPEETEWARKCPMCDGKMNFHTQESIWMCYTCGHEELVKDDAAGAGESATAPETASAPEQASSDQPGPAARPAAGMPPAAPLEGKLMPLASTPVAAPLRPQPPAKKPSPKRKACPVCSKQMNWLEKERSWQCASCGYRRMVF